MSHRVHARSGRADEQGASAVEYGLLITGIAGIIVAAVFLFGGGSSGLFNRSCETIGAEQSSGWDCPEP